jgi:ribulose 1,5-bisphosphate synthetase/thiazole synthase
VIDFILSCLEKSLSVSQDIQSFLISTTMTTKFFPPTSNGVDTGVVVNGHHSHHVNGTPLNITIVGAGIGGLAAAIGLRRNGHKVAVSHIQLILSA